MGKELVFSESKFSDYCALFFVLFILFNEVVIFLFWPQFLFKFNKVCIWLWGFKIKGFEEPFFV